MGAPGSSIMLSPAYPGVSRPVPVVPDTAREDGREPTGDMGRDPGGVDVEAKRDAVDRRDRFEGKTECGDGGRSLMLEASCFVLEDLVLDAARGRDRIDWAVDP